MDNITEFSLGKSLLMRFVRGFIAGAVSVMITINANGVNTFTDLKGFLSALGLSAVIGGIGGALLTVDKYIRG